MKRTLRHRARRARAPEFDVIATGAALTDQRGRVGDFSRQQLAPHGGSDCARRHLRDELTRLLAAFRRQKGDAPVAAKVERKGGGGATRASVEARCGLGAPLNDQRGLAQGGAQGTGTNRRERDVAI